MSGRRADDERDVAGGEAVFSGMETGRASARGADRGGHVHRVVSLAADGVAKAERTPAQVAAQVADRDGFDGDVRGELVADRDGRGGGVATVAAPAMADPDVDSADSAASGDSSDSSDDESAADLDLTGPQILGRCLALARKHAGLAIEEVADVTRIRPTMIRQIESGDFSRCGGGVYARGHIRALAKAAGVDPEPWLSEHSTQGPVEPPAPAPRPFAPAPARAATPKSAGRTHARVIRPAMSRASRAAQGTAAAAATVPVLAEPRRKMKADPLGKQPKSANWTAAMLVVLLGLVVFAGMQLVGDGDKNAPAAAVHVPPPAKPAAPPAPAPAAAPVGVAIRISAVNAPSWLAVFSADGRKLFDNLLLAGSVQTFQDGHQLGVTVGNASAIRLQLNGKDLGSAGGDGQVVHLTVNPGGVVTG